MNQSEHWQFTKSEWTKPEFFSFLEKSFSDTPAVVYDIGANVGAWGDIILKNFPVKRLYSFEPDLENFAFLDEKLTDNRCRNINKGVYYGKKRVIAYEKGDGNCGGYFVEGLEPFGIRGKSSGRIFELSTLEEINVEKPDIVKIDIEGAEKNVLAHSEIVKQCPNLIVEWHFEEDARKFFAEHLKHTVAHSLEEKMFLLKV